MILALLLELWLNLRARLQPVLLCLLALTLGPGGCSRGDAQDLDPSLPTQPTKAMEADPTSLKPQTSLPQPEQDPLPRTSSSLAGQTHPPETQVLPASLPPHPTRLYPYAGVFCGTGASTSPGGTTPTAGCGAGLSFVPLPIYVEFGVLGPQANRSYVSGYVSTDFNIPLAPDRHQVLPSAILGYSRLFETGHALDYGIALTLPRPWSPKDDLRLELRDYWTFANPNQHNVMLRVGLITPATD